MLLGLGMCIRFEKIYLSEANVMPFFRADHKSFTNSQGYNQPELGLISAHGYAGLQVLRPRPRLRQRVASCAHLCTGYTCASAAHFRVRMQLLPRRMA